MEYETFFAGEHDHMKKAFREFTSRKDIVIHQYAITGVDSPHSSIKIVVLYEKSEVVVSEK